MISNPTRYILGVIVLVAPLASAQTEGRTLFVAHCARCHGVGGTGGEGPNLNRPVLSRTDDDEGIAKIIREGIEGTEMPGTWMLSDAEVERVVRYVRSLGEMPLEELSGDVGRGKRLYDGRGACSTCHVVDGAGGIAGPPLNGIGSRRGAAHLKESLVAPGAVVAAEYVFVRAVKGDGAEIVGSRVNEDSFTVQIRDPSGAFHSFDKRSLEVLEKKPGESLMPSYAPDFSASEIEDLVAYLASLRGEP